MRSRLAIGLLLLLCGCSANMQGLPGGNMDLAGGGGSGGSGGGGGTGGSGGGNGSFDMSGNADASAAYSCNEILSCIAMCGGFTNRTCVMTCRSGATQTARGLYSQLSGCLRQTCFVHPDAANDPCMNGGMPSQQCKTCLSDATMGGGACSTEYAACMAN
jgi:hypothetical protein